MQVAITRIASDEPGPGQLYALQARKSIERLRAGRPGIRIEIRWCPAHEGVEGNEKADEDAMLAAEEPDARGVEWMGHSDRYGRRRMPLTRSIANIRREIAERKWEEARSWSEKWIKKKKDRLPEKMRQNAAVARGPKRLAERLHQLSTVHYRTGQYLEWTKNTSTAECGWCQCKTQTWNHLFKESKQWKGQQKTLWAEVQKATKKGKNRFKIRDLFPDERCTRIILDFLHATGVGSRVGPKTAPKEPGNEEAEVRRSSAEARDDGLDGRG